jgi:outer membrane protein insertion porin family
MAKRFITYSFLLVALFVSGCSNTKKLAAGESLFLGGDVSVTDREVEKKQRKVIASDLEDAVRPKPNRKALGVRFRLLIHNYVGKNKTKGPLYKFREKNGEEPVLASSVDMELNKLIFENVLQNRGFFYPKIQGELVTKRKKTRAKFKVQTGPQYFINETFFQHDTTSTLGEDIYALREETLLKPGQPYNLDLIKGERERIDRALKEIGYYFFKSDYILVKVDTSLGNQKVNMYVTLKSDDETPEQMYNIYNIRDVYIFPNYRLRGRNTDTNKANAVEYEGYKVVDSQKKFRPSVFAYTMHFKPGDEYNRTDQNTTLNRIINLNVFKFVKNRFEPINDSLMDVYYYLTPYPKKAIRFELGAMTQNDSRVGTQGSISWKNRNTFKGAEEFTVKVNGGYEVQYGGNGNAGGSEGTSGAGGNRRPDIYEGGIETSLSIPRLLVPFFDPRVNGSFIPRTFIKAGAKLEAQSSLLRIYSYRFSYGYNWKEDMRKEHQLYPFNITYVKTDTLSNQNLNLFYGNLIFNGLIIGPTYQYNYSTQIGPPRLNDYYFSGLVDFSGNILGLVQKADYENNPKQIFGASYAQYMKYSVDFRYYHRVVQHPKEPAKNTTWANRVIVGFGYPYGNSAQMPNVKQFFSGGNSSLRGFRSRLLGPGTFYDSTGSLIQTLGDLKLEFNTELRANIWNFINGAAFVDMGNIWLYRDNPVLPGGKFTSSFYKELAVDAGLGLRLDFKILVLRLDLAIPLRKPWLPENDRWVIDDIAFGNNKWRGQNMIFNLAIGYPF